MTRKPLAHSRLPASSAERWFNCPGSIAMTAHFPTEPNRYMAEGTVAHGLAADALMNRWDIEKLESFIGTHRVQDGFEIEITEEMTDAVWVYVDAVRECADRPGAIVIIEERIELGHINSILFGTCDACVIWPYDALHVFDFKYGSGMPVSPWKNKQLLEYAVGFFFREDVERITLNIVQPRSKAGEDVGTYELCAAELLEFERDLAKAVKAALAPDAPLVAGDWCRKTFCPAFAQCPAAGARARDLVVSDFEDKPPALEALEITKIKAILDRADFIVGWVEKVKEHAKERALRGEHIPGYKLVTSYGHRKWSDETAVVEAFETSYGERIYDQKLKSPAQLEKIVGKKEVEGLTFRPENGYRLVTENAKGEPVKLTKIEDDFD